MSEEILTFDVVIVGGGPAGLAAAIKLRQLSSSISVCVLEKGSEIGAHILSGLIFEPHALDELIPDWKKKGAPLSIKVTEERFLILGPKKGWRVPNFLLPKQLKNEGNYVGSLGNLCQWLANEATALGVEIFPGFAAAEVLFDEKGRVKGVRTGEKGVAKDGSHKPEYQPGIQLQAKYTVMAEGCRGYLSEQLMKCFKLREKKDPQTYGIGIKEIWVVKPQFHQPGLVQHLVGWPLPADTYGGAFLYHLDNNQIALGMAVGLDYKNTYLDPYEEMQRFKTHPLIKPIFEGAERLVYGSRALNEGGFQSIPELIFPGGAFIGCSAGFLNVPKIKGSHNAMKTGMLAAESIFKAFTENPEGLCELIHYPKSFKASWVYKELYAARNFRSYFRWGLWLGMLLGGLDLKLFQGKAPWTLHHSKPDRQTIRLAKNCRKINYPAPDGIITFNRTSSLYLSNVYYTENQPNHLHLRDPIQSMEISYKHYASPEQRYCPAGVYEILLEGNNEPRLQINAANCVQCKTCDISDPADNIVWTPPEGGSGPNYQGM